MKKKWIILCGAALCVIAVVIVLVTGIGKKEKLPEVALVGGWQSAASQEITAERQAIFDKAMEGLVGVNYEPVAYLGSQVVAGMNHAYLCKAQVVYPGAEPYYAVVYIYEDLQGGAEITNIETLEAE